MRRDLRLTLSLLGSSLALAEVKIDETHGCGGDSAAERAEESCADFEAEDNFAKAASISPL